MNWTGGRLQRSKANAKTLVKTQKQHFAKARLRLHNGLPTQSPLTLSVSHRQYRHDAGMEDDMPIGDDHRYRKRSCSHGAFHDKHTGRFHSHGSKHHKPNSFDEPQPKRGRPEDPLDSEHGDISAMASEVSRHGHNTTWETKPNQAGVVDHYCKSTATEANTLQNVKRKLLEKPDWMGLSAAQPLKMRFTAVEEMENIGKRRKLTKADIERAAADQLHSRFHPAVNRHHHMGKHGSNASILHTEDASVRIGANIHQTQATPRLASREQPTPNASQSVSTESMLLDLFDGEASVLDQIRKAEVLRPRDGQHLLSPRLWNQGETGLAFPDSDRVSKYKESHSIPSREYASSEKERSALDIERTLPTLDQLRDSKNFDELKAKSASGSSKGLSFPPPPLPRPMAQKEIVKNGDESCRQHIPSSSDDRARSVDKDSFAQQKSSSCGNFRKGHNTRADPTKSSTEFWSKYNSQSMSQTHVEMHDRSYPSDSGEQPHLPMNLDAPFERTTAAGTSAAKPGCQEGFVEVSLPRPVFTLEHQVSDEAIAKSRMDASQSLPLDLLKNTDSIVMASSTTRLDPFLTKSPRRPSHYGVSPHHSGPLSNRRGDVPTFKTPPRNATILDRGILDVRSTIDRSLKLLNNKRRSPSQYGPEISLPKNVMTRLFRPALLNDLLNSRRVQHYDNHLSGSSSRSSCTALAKDQEGNENEARMESVIPGFNEVRNAFKFQPTIRRRKANGKDRSSHKIPEAGEMMGSDKRTWTPQSIRVAQTTNPAKSIHTFANSVLYRADDLPPSRGMIGIEPLETDFVTQMSPMEGKLDEHLENVSFYKNAARNARSYVPAPSLLSRSPRPLQSAANVAHAYSSSLDTMPFRQVTGTLFRDVQDARVGEQKWTSPGYEWLPGSRSTCRQPLQVPTDMPVVCTQKFTLTPQAKRKRSNSSPNSPRPDLCRLSSPRPDLARANHNDTRTLGTQEQSMISFPSNDTLIRVKPHDSKSDNCWTTTSGFLNLSPAFSVERAHCSLVEAVQRNQTAESFPMYQESTAEEEQNPSTPGTRDTAIFDEHPLADEDALHMLSTDTFGAYSGSQGSASSNAEPLPFLHNIHTGRGQLSTFKKPTHFVGRKVTAWGRSDCFEPPLLGYREIRPLKRRTSVVGKCKMPNNPIFGGDFVAEDIESMSNM
jgi:hypothetical protein